MEAETRATRVTIPETVKEKLISLGASASDSFLVAVSGGADSTALLLAMSTAIEEKGLLTAAHLDHGVRPGSSHDGEIVSQLCDTLGVGLITDRLQPGELETCRRSCGSLEAGMRFLRYRFLHAAAVKTGSRWIVTGHTADDQSETVFFRAMRGMDWRSLGSIPEKRENILRPLMDVPRSATRMYCRSMGISPVIDPSNYDESYARSRVRHRILPGLVKSFHPGVMELLRRMGGAAGRLSLAEENLLEGIMPGFRDWDSLPVGRESVLALPGILRKRYVVDYLSGLMGRYPSFKLGEEVLEFITSGRNGRWILPGDAILTLSYGTVRVSRKTDPCQRGIPDAGLELRIPGRLAIPSAGIAITATERTLERPGEYPVGKTALLAEEKVTRPLQVRKRRRGDIFMPLGMNKAKKLKDFFVDRKVPREMRDLVPLIVDDQGEILWVGGIEISQKAAMKGLKGEKAIMIRIDDLASAGDDRAKNSRAT